MLLVMNICDTRKLERCYYRKSAGNKI